LFAALCFVTFPTLCSAWHIANLHAKTMKFIGPWLPGLASCLIEMSFVLAGLSKYLEQQELQKQQQQNLQNVMSLMTLPKEF